MKLVATMPVRNEGWVLGLSLRVALLWCDEVVVLDHASIDRTPSILQEISDEQPGRVHVIASDDPTWDEMQHRQRMLEHARKRGATHVAIVDADEILTGDLTPKVVRDQILHTPAGHLLQMPGYNLRGGIHRYHANGVWGHRFFSLAFPDRPDLYWAGDRFHHREPFGSPQLRGICITPHGKGGVMHLWGASEHRLAAKHALYKLTERQRWPAKPLSEIEEMYSMSMRGDRNMPASQWAFAEVPRQWWEPYQQWLGYLDLDGEPWQIEACRSIVAKTPNISAGFDLFGVV